MSGDFIADAVAGAEKAMRHSIVTDVMAELRLNLGVSDDGLPAYGILKVAYRAAMVGYAVALDVDPNVLRLSRRKDDA